MFGWLLALWNLFLSLFVASFQPRKLKSNVDAALIRIKQVKTKINNTVANNKREIAKLLANNKNSLAGVKVENIIKDVNKVEALNALTSHLERMQARYILLCEAKECPSEMKEEVTTVIYAALRLSEIPELAQIKNQLVLRYNKKFVDRATEDRDLTVDKNIIARLSAQTSDQHIIDKYLEDIARELDVEGMKTNGALTEPVKFVHKTHNNDMDDLTRRLDALRKKD